MKQEKRTLLISILMVFFTFLGGNNLEASTFAPKDTPEPPLLTYQGASGVEIRSYVPGYDLDKLEEIYNEFTKNTIGEEIAFLSHINLYPDYPRGTDTVGMWYGEWFRDQLAPGRYIDLFGVGDDNPYVLNTLSHEYGHHFLYYYLNKKEGITTNYLDSHYAKIRNLTYYAEVNNGDHCWSVLEIAAEDYVQLFGSPDLIRIRSYQYTPQENTHIPLAWEVPGLYDYFVNLSGLKGKKDQEAPSKPLLQLTEVTPSGLFFQWEESTDDSCGPLTYSVVGVTQPTKDSIVKYLMNITKENNQYKSSLSRKQLREDRVEDILVKLIVMDQSGNAVSSNIQIDLNHPENYFSYVFPGQRICGIDRYRTSVAISQETFPQGSACAILVTGENFPDALSAAPLAQKYNAPILLTSSKTLDLYTKAEIKRLGAENIIIIGGTGAVSQGIEESLKSKGISVRRIEGTSRYETSLAIAKELGNFKEFFVCTGENFPDALSAAAVAASEGMPVLLTPSNNLPERFLEFIEDHDPTQPYVVGGTGVISNHVFNQLPHAKRLSGNDRYETNLAILEEFSLSFTGNTAYLVTGTNYPDALSGSVLAAQMKSPILLAGTNLTNEAKSYLSSKGLNDQNVQIIGGSGVVSDSLLKKIIE
ncbi:cell wall-binding repeat-containing protein [Desulfitobacterium sp. PCE1]|uniref:cell wall-binding repeat-containing protein n=1 Tax=Desulfitobacterium sp. PCE1 TaxID=146907 RepID=UPI000368BB78|nr:cell wall-binding repeat-containing protein [Desulfitobacterium sp. PCE1]